MSRAPAWAAAVVSSAGLYLLSGAGGELNLRGDGLVLLCAAAFAAHILVTARAVASHDVGALLVQLALCGLFCLAVAASDGRLEGPTRRGGVVGARHHLARGQRARLLRPRASPSATRRRRKALVLASEPAFAGLFGSCWTASGSRRWPGSGRRRSWRRSSPSRSSLA